MKFDKFKKIGFTMALALIATNAMAGEIENNQVIEKIEAKMENSILNYQQLGFYKNLNDVKYKVSFNDEVEDSSIPADNMVLLALKPVENINNLTLSSDTGLFALNDSAAGLNNEVMFVNFHELAHLEFAKRSYISTNRFLGELATSEILLNTSEKSTKTSYDFVQENFADVYGGLAYLKYNDFSNDSIEHIKSIRNARLAVSILEDKEHGENTDSHDTAKSLSILIGMLEDGETLNKIKQISNPVEYSNLAKDITRDIYLEVINDPVVIKELTSEKNKDFKETYNKYLKSIHLKEVNSQLYADFKSKELETKPGNIDGFCLVSDKEKIKQNLDDNKYVLSKIRSMRIEYTKCGAENKLKI